MTVEAIKETRKGRPCIDEDKKKKNTTKVIRIPKDIADLLKEVARRYEAGEISREDIERLGKING